MRESEVFVPKGWGFEKWITNNEKYCGKVLYFVKGRKCSFHYHVNKDEAFYVQSGRILLKYAEHDDLSTAEQLVLERGDSFRVTPGLRHQMIGLEDSELIEFSTTHDDNDSYRVVRGD